MMDTRPTETLSYPWREPPERGSAIEVADGVLWLRLPLPMKLDHVNVFALDDGDSWTIVDTGFDSRLGREIWTGLLAGPLRGKPVGRVIVTHHHPDHVGLAGWFQTDHGAELLTTRTAWLLARMLTLDVQEVWPPETIAFWQSAGMPADMLERRMAERPFNFADMVTPMPQGYTRIRQDDVLQFGGRSWDVHIGHGHAPEHATFWSRDDDLVLAGDQILPSISPNLGVYATEPMADPVGDWLESCARLAELTTPSQLVLGGHKLPFRGAPLRMRQLLENHHGALARLEPHLVTPKTAAECFMPIFRRNIGESEFGLALVEAVAHVSHLYQAGRAERSQREDGAWLYSCKS